MKQRLPSLNGGYHQAMKANGKIVYFSSLLFNSIIIVIDE